MKIRFKVIFAALICCSFALPCSAGRVFSWGSNINGETNVPPGLTNVLSLAGGSYHYLALRGVGTVVAWGLNTYGQTNVPADVVNPSEISAGMDDSLVLNADGSIRMWGLLPYISVT